MTRLETPAERVERRSIPEPNSGCWLWLGGLTHDGYGWASWMYKSMGVHRLSWFAHYGEIPKGLCVLHRCDVRCCVNPDHLFLGTPQDNTDDMIRKGRDVKIIVPLGSENARAKLTEADVHLILSSPLNGVKLGKMLGVSSVNIYNIRNGHRWKHIRRDR